MGEMFRKEYSGVFNSGGWIDGVGARIRLDWGGSSLHQVGHVPVLYGHDINDVCGRVLRYSVDGSGQLVGVLELIGERGSEVSEMIEMGVLRGLSTGTRGNASYVLGGKEYRDMKWHELSVVAVPLDGGGQLDVRSDGVEDCIRCGYGYFDGNQKKDEKKVALEKKGVDVCGTEQNNRVMIVSEAQLNLMGGGFNQPTHPVNVQATHPVSAPQGQSMQNVQSMNAQPSQPQPHGQPAGPAAPLVNAQVPAAVQAQPQYAPQVQVQVPNVPQVQVQVPNVPQVQVQAQNVHSQGAVAQVPIPAQNQAPVQVQAQNVQGQVQVQANQGMPQAAAAPNAQGVPLTAQAQGVPVNQGVPVAQPQYVPAAAVQAQPQYAPQVQVQSPVQAVSAPQAQVPVPSVTQAPVPQMQGQTSNPPVMQPGQTSNPPVMQPAYIPQAQVQGYIPQPETQVTYQPQMQPAMEGIAMGYPAPYAPIQGSVGTGGNNSNVKKFNFDVSDRNAWNQMSNVMSPGGLSDVIALRAGKEIIRNVRGRQDEACELQLSMQNDVLSSLSTQLDENDAYRDNYKHSVGHMDQMVERSTNRFNYFKPDQNK